MPYYAKITHGVVTAVTQTTGPVDAPDMVAIDGLLDITGHSHDPATGTFTPPPPPAPPPVLRVPALGALLAIDAAGLAPAYEAWANAPERTFAQRAFVNKAQFWQRDDATLVAAATALGLTADDVDALFSAAAQLA